MPANRLLPLRSSVERGEGSRVVGIREDAADDVFEALSSRTAREILAALYEEPDTASSVADEVDTSLQNATYHLEKLLDADLVEVADTWYSEQGREMKVYAPAAESLVVFASDEASEPSLKERLLSVLGVVGVLGVGSLVVQRLFERYVTTGGGGGDVKPTYNVQMGEATETAAQATKTAMQDQDVNLASAENVSQTTAAAAETAGQASQGVPPGALFFAGGLLVVAVLLGYNWYRQR